MVRKVIVLGGGSAGFSSAITLKQKLRDVAVSVIRSKDIGIIGVGEGSNRRPHQLSPRHRLHRPQGARLRPLYPLAMGHALICAMQ